MVIACDLPLLTDQSLQLLINERDPIKYATAFISPENDLPEPLIAIWEPKGLAVLRENFESGFNCPRKTLINNNIKLISNQLPHEQLNANTPEEMDYVLKNWKVNS
ncbi:molybdopterin-guanine dinucleotide biosynthesis protein MobA [compost metagenome]